MAVGSLDFSVPSNLSLTIGGIEFGPFVESLSLSRPLPDIATPLSWTGSVRLVTPYPASQLPESLNDLTNPGRWAMGVHPVILSIGSNVIARLRILEYFYEDDEELAGTARLGDLLTLFDSDGPAQAWQDLVSGTGFTGFGTQWDNIISQAFTSAGIANDLSNVSIQFPAPKDKPSGSVVKWGQQILGERGYWLYVDTASEQVKAVKYPVSVTAGDILFHRPRSGVERFRRREGVLPPREKVIVSGSADGIPSPSESGPQTTYDYDEEGRLIGETTFRTITDSPSLVKKEIKVRQALAAINPKLFPTNYAMVTSSLEVQTKTANGAGQVTSDVVTRQKPLGVVLPDLVKTLTANDPGASLPYYAGTVEAESTEISYDLAAGLVKTKKTETSRLFRFGTTDYTSMTGDLELDEYDGLTLLGPDKPPPNSYKQLYRQYRRDESVKTSAGYKMKGLGLRKTIRKEDAQPPNLDVLRSEQTANQIPINGDAEFAIAGTTPFTKKREDISVNTLTSSIECQQCASLQGNMMFHGYYGRQFNLPIPDEWAANPKPLSVVDIHNGRFVLTGDVITLSDGTIEIAWNANCMGAIPTVPEA